MPEYPAGLEYLLEWSADLFYKSGADLNGIGPLTYLTIDAWARLTDTDVAPHEVEALLLLDFVKRSPGEG